MNCEFFYNPISHSCRYSEVLERKVKQWGLQLLSFLYFIKLKLIGKNVILEYRTYYLYGNYL